MLFTDTVILIIYFIVFKIHATIFKTLRPISREKFLPSYRKQFQIKIFHISLFLKTNPCYVQFSNKESFIFSSRPSIITLSLK